MDKQHVVTLLLQAANNPAVRSIAEQALGRYIRRIARAEAKLCGLSKDDADEAAHRALVRVLKYVTAKGITDPAHIVNLAVYCLRGGPQRDANNTVISRPNGKLLWRKGTLDLILAQKMKDHDKHISLDAPLPHADGNPDGEFALGNIIPASPPSSVEEREPTKPIIRRWVYELERVAEFPRLRPAQRVTLRTVVLYIKDCLSPPGCNGKPLSFEDLVNAPIDSLLNQSDLYGFDASVYTLAKSAKEQPSNIDPHYRWRLTTDVCRFLSAMMEDTIKPRRPYTPERLQATINKRVHRVLPFLYGVAEHLAVDLLKVKGICQDRGILPAEECLHETFSFTMDCESVLPHFDALSEHRTPGGIVR